MKITKRQLRKIIKEEKQALLKEYSDYPSWTDLSDQMDDITEMIDMLTDKYILSNWLFQNRNKGNAIAEGVAQKLEQLYRDSERLTSLIQGSGALKDERDTLEDDEAEEEQYRLSTRDQ